MQLVLLINADLKYSPNAMHMPLMIVLRCLPREQTMLLVGDTSGSDSNRSRSVFIVEEYGRVGGLRVLIMTGSWDLSEHGPVYALAVGPYGVIFALSWNREKEGQPTTVVALDSDQGEQPRHSAQSYLHTASGVIIRHDPYNLRAVCTTTVGKVMATWPVPDVASPHDMAVVASPVRLAGKERPIALLIAETRQSGSRLQKYILLPEGRSPLLCHCLIASHLCFTASCLFMLLCSLLAYQQGILALLLLLLCL